MSVLTPIQVLGSKEPLGELGHPEGFRFAAGAVDGQSLRGGSDEPLG